MSLDNRNNQPNEGKEHNVDNKKEQQRRPQTPNYKRPNNNNDDGAGKIMKNVMIWVGILGSVAILWMLINGGAQGYETIQYSEYKQFVEEGRVGYAKITKSDFNNYEFIGMLKEPATIVINNNKTIQVKQFRTKLAYVDSETEKMWQSKGITWKYEEADDIFMTLVKTMLPWVLIIGVYIFIMRRMQNGGPGGKNIFSFGKSRARLMNEGTNPITFADVAGADEAKYELAELIEFLRDPGKFQRLGGKIPRGVLLLGPPGTGKTLLARAVAGEANVPFFSISGADFVEMFVGVGASRVRDLFEQAQKNSPCIIFIDEIDAVGRHRGAGLGGGHDEREQTLNQLLVEMDGFEQNSGVIIIAATNRPDVLDPALLRPGRFDRQVVVDRPDIRGREAILKVHSRKVPLADDVDLSVIARSTPGLSGADLANLMNESALFAARRGSDVVTNDDIENAKDKILMGVERKSMVISDKEKESTAYHEMGHALAGLLLEGNDPVHKVTIIPRGRALGVTSYLPTEDTHTLSRDYVLVRIITLLAGRAAELIIFNQLTTGAGNDLERATMFARKMVTEWGMSDVIGPVCLATKSDEPFLGRDMASTKNISEETARTIDNEIRRILVECMHKAEQLLRDNLELLHTTSKILLERETLDASELQMIMRGETLPPPANIRKLAAANGVAL